MVNSLVPASYKGESKPVLLPRLEEIDSALTVAEKGKLCIYAAESAYDLYARGDTSKAIRELSTLQDAARRCKTTEGSCKKELKWPQMS